jgi:hypothetical protein
MVDLAAAVTLIDVEISVMQGNSPMASHTVLEVFRRDD